MQTARDEAKEVAENSGLNRKMPPRSCVRFGFVTLKGQQEGAHLTHVQRRMARSGLFRSIDHDCVF